jgi:metal-responsive CopG/Arc/MetJ family transcriptional regulator
MKKGRQIITLSVPPDVAREYDRMADKKEVNRSQLFREMFAQYKTEDLKGRFFKLQRYGSIQARRSRIYTEEEVDRIIFGER